MKLNRKILFGFFALLNLTIAIVVFFTLNTKRVEEFMGVRIGMTKQEVTYILGFPEFYTDSTSTNFIQTKNKSQSFDVADIQQLQESLNLSNEWSYLGGVNTLYSFRTHVVFSQNGRKVNRIYCYTNKDNAYVSPNTCPLYGLSLMMSEEEMYAKLGKPTYEEIDGLTKQVTYEKLGLDVSLSKKKIYMIELSNL